jgi:hypothetical protein
VTIYFRSELSAFVSFPSFVRATLNSRIGVDDDGGGGDGDGGVIRSDLIWLKMHFDTMPTYHGRVDESIDVNDIFNIIVTDISTIQKIFLF